MLDKFDLEAADLCLGGWLTEDRRDEVAGYLRSRDLLIRLEFEPSGWRPRSGLEALDEQVRVMEQLCSRVAQLGGLKNHDATRERFLALDLLREELGRQKAQVERVVRDAEAVIDAASRAYGALATGVQELKVVLKGPTDKGPGRRKS
jgi:hypothetical protein